MRYFSFYAVFDCVFSTFKPVDGWWWLLLLDGCLFCFFFVFRLLSHWLIDRATAWVAEILPLVNDKFIWSQTRFGESILIEEQTQKQKNKNCKMWIGVEIITIVFHLMGKIRIYKQNQIQIMLKSCMHLRNWKKKREKPERSKPVKWEFTISLSPYSNRMDFDWLPLPDVWLKTAKRWLFAFCLSTTSLLTHFYWNSIGDSKMNRNKWIKLLIICSLQSSIFKSCQMNVVHSKQKLQN